MTETSGGIIRDAIHSIWEGRTILKALVIKNLVGQYRNSYLGFFWQFLNPAIGVILFYFLFTALRTNNIPEYWMFLCIGMFPFTFMNSNIVGASNAIVGNSSMVKKIKISRVIIVVSVVVSVLITFVISYIFVILLMAISGHVFAIVPLLLVIPWVILMVIFSTGTALLLSSICVYVRDLGYFINAFSRVLFWITPIFYSVSQLSGGMAFIVWANPMTWFVESFHDLLYSGIIPDTYVIIGCIIIALTMLSIGTVVFKKLEPGFAERI